MSDSMAFLSRDGHPHSNFDGLVQRALRSLKVHFRGVQGRLFVCLLRVLAQLSTIIQNEWGVDAAIFLCFCGCCCCRPAARRLDLRVCSVGCWSQVRYNTQMPDERAPVVCLTNFDMLRLNSVAPLNFGIVTVRLLAFLVKSLGSQTCPHESLQYLNASLSPHKPK